MNNEVIFLYALQAIMGLMGLLMAYMVLKYLNHKALGMQTINDQMIKDLIYISLLFWIDTIITEFIAEYKSNLLNHDVALFIIVLNVMVGIAAVWQMSMILIMRYMSVFYHVVMNNVDDRLVTRVTRSFVGFTAIMSAMMINFENTFVYQFLTGGKESNDFNLLPVKPMILAVAICLIILILTQYKIEMFKKSVESQAAQFDQLEACTSKEGNQDEFYCKYNIKNTHRIEITVLSITFLELVFMSLWETDSTDKLLLKILIVQFINTNVIPILFIVRNENMYTIFKYNIRKLLCCKM